MKHLERKKNYFFTSFLTLLLSVGAFCAFKALLPESLFAKPIYDYKDDIIIDSDNDNNNDSLILIAMVEPVKTEADNTVVIEEYAPFDGLVRFFQKLFTLEKTKKGSVRIAYFGDSMIEGDLIVQDVRKGYQKKFGGQGIGFIPLSSQFSYLGASIKFEYSPEWDTYSNFIAKKSPTSLGVSGFVSLTNPEASVWTHYKSGSLPLVSPTIFYGYSSNKNAKMTITTSKGTTDPIQLKPNGILNKYSVASPSNELKIQFDNADSIPFYGVNFSGSSGVIIDDFSLRGNAGLSLGSLNVALMNAFQREFNYDLIVLQFGVNVLKIKPGTTNYDWFANKMLNVVNHLKKCFPGVDILVVSQADKAVKYGTEMKTDTTLTALIKAQEKYARNTGSAFIDLFQMMGGEGTMVKWVSEAPPLAQTDYAHFNARGARKIGNLIFEKLDQEYENFKIKNNLYEEKEEKDENK